MGGGGDTLDSSTPSSFLIGNIFSDVHFRPAAEYLL